MKYCLFKYFKINLNKTTSTITCYLASSRCFVQSKMRSDKNKHCVVIALSCHPASHLGCKLAALWRQVEAVLAS